MRTWRIGHGWAVDWKPQFIRCRHLCGHETTLTLVRSGNRLKYICTGCRLVVPDEVIQRYLFHVERSKFWALSTQLRSYLKGGLNADW